MSGASSVRMNSWGFPEKITKKLDSTISLNSYNKPNIKDLETEAVEIKNKSEEKHFEALVKF